MIKDYTYTTIRSIDIGYGIKLAKGAKLTLLDWNDDEVRVLWGNYPYRMERDTFEYLVYED